jgi:hypothetical protein
VTEEPNRKTITSDLPPENKDFLRESLGPEAIEARKNFLRDIADIERRHFTYKACPSEKLLLRVIGYDSDGKPNLWYCPRCRKETDKPLEISYDPCPKSYTEFDAITGTYKELPLKAQEIAKDIKANYIF